MAKLRGSTDAKLEAIIATLKLLLDFDNLDEIKSGINSIITGTEKWKRKPNTSQSNPLQQ